MFCIYILSIVHLYTLSMRLVFQMSARTIFDLRLFKAVIATNLICIWCQRAHFLKFLGPFQV